MLHFSYCSFDTNQSFSIKLALGRWVTSQRADKKAGTIDKSNERRLTAIGFVWDRYDKKVNGQEDTVEEKIVHNTRSRKRS